MQMHTLQRAHGHGVRPRPQQQRRWHGHQPSLSPPLATTQPQGPQQPPQAHRGSTLSPYVLLEMARCLTTAAPMPGPPIQQPPGVTHMELLVHVAKAVPQPSSRRQQAAMLEDTYQVLAGRRGQHDLSPYLQQLQRGSGWVAHPDMPLIRLLLKPAATAFAAALQLTPGDRLKVGNYTFPVSWAPAMQPAGTTAVRLHNVPMRMTKQGLTGLLLAAHGYSLDSFLVVSEHLGGKPGLSGGPHEADWVVAYIRPPTDDPLLKLLPDTFEAEPGRVVRVSVQGRTANRPDLWEAETAWCKEQQQVAQRLPGIWAAMQQQRLQQGAGASTQQLPQPAAVPQRPPGAADPGTAAAAQAAASAVAAAFPAPGSHAADVDMPDAPGGNGDQPGPATGAASVAVDLPVDLDMGEHQHSTSPPDLQQSAYAQWRGDSAQGGQAVEQAVGIWDETGEPALTPEALEEMCQALWHDLQRTDIDTQQWLRTYLHVPDVGYGDMGDAAAAAAPTAPAGPGQVGPDVGGGSRRQRRGQQWQPQPEHQQPAGQQPPAVRDDGAPCTRSGRRIKPVLDPMLCTPAVFGERRQHDSSSNGSGQRPTAGGLTLPGPGTPAQQRPASGRCRR